MCGIAGMVRQHPNSVSIECLGRMAAAIRHRGPSGYGFYRGRHAGLTNVSVRGGELDAHAQPLANEDGQIVVTASCEIFNRDQLRHDLQSRGHRFRTRADAEILVHGYEEWGADLLQRLEGQFAFAIYDRNRSTLIVARDRFGVRPLYYAQRDGNLFFASEIKAILAAGEVDAGLDQRGLDEILRFGGARPPRTAFSGIACLEPGTYGTWKDGAFWLRHYYEIDFPEVADEPADVIEQLDELMLRSVGRRMRGEGNVGAYLSGGLDSSITASLASRASANQLPTFSISYAQPEFDRSLHQHEVAAALGTAHTAGVVEMETLAESFPDVVWHCETPLLRSEPALMFHLAKITKESGVNAVIGGEGADELFLGSDVFKQASVRRFCLRRPESCVRPLLFARAGAADADHPLEYESAYHALIDAASPADPLFSHLPRFLSTPIDDFYARDFKAGLGGVEVIRELRAGLPTRFFGWSPLNQAAYLEMTTALSPYLLSSYGDRVAMAHGVRVRYPYLDHRLFEFVAALPTGSRLRGLRGKEVLRRWAKRILPRTLRLPDDERHVAAEANGFVLSATSAWIADSLAPEAIRRVGIFSAAAVGALMQRCASGVPASPGERRAMLGVASTQLWHHKFVETTSRITALSVEGASVLLEETASATPSMFAMRPAAADRVGFA
ncbi:MAG TPA: asparagine synthase (glutamine-hydrolyzing) [Gemmatimonadaceae bacterium]|nr:asparagine synthase (glutamine-hydrolyzing) [Gemmatimonadaceae bacterium]